MYGGVGNTRATQNLENCDIQCILALISLFEMSDFIFITLGEFKCRLLLSSIIINPLMLKLPVHFMS